MQSDSWETQPKLWQGAKREDLHLGELFPSLYMSVTQLSLSLCLPLPPCLYLYLFLVMLASSSTLQLAIPVSPVLIHVLLRQAREAKHGGPKECSY